MKLGILGTRGIPANYGGFETFAEELAVRLVERGHTVTVFCRSHYASEKRKEYRGVQLKILPTIRHKYLDTPVHSLLSALWAMFQPFDAILICNAANGFCCAVLHLGGIPSLLNLDGIERQRQKWGPLGRGWYRLSEFLSIWLADRLISDAGVIQEYYRREHRQETECIPYGFSRLETEESRLLGSLGIAPRGYYLYVSRLEPENNAHVVLEAHRRSGSRLPLLLVGDAPYARSYIDWLRSYAGEGVHFTGAVYGKEYHALQARAWAYLQATEVGGTHPALVEGMGYGNMVLANDTPENREVLGETGFFYRKNDAADLARIMRETEGDPRLREAKGESARLRVASRYNWETVTTSYERIFQSLRRRKDIPGKAPAGNTASR